MRTTLEVRDLDSRRGWARARAAVSCVVGVAVFAATAAAFATIVLAAAARAWSWFRDESILDAPVWDAAPGGAGALALIALVISFVTVFVHFWRGATAQVLREIGAVPLVGQAAPGSHARTFINVVEALSIGIGRPMPHLAMVEDPTPNAVSLRSSRTRVLVVTTGLAALPRDEIEAVCAHELGHLWARDAHWVTSGMVALARARRIGRAVFGLGVVVIFVVGAFAYYVEVILWGTGIVALMLLGLGSFSSSVLRRLESGVRSSADEIADVVAVRLAKNPEALGTVCVRLADDPATVRRSGWRSELLWFEAVELVPPVGSGRQMTPEQMAAAVRSRSSLLERAERAYAEARVPPPPVLLDAVNRRRA